MAETNPLEGPRIANSITDLIGRTPIVRVGKTAAEAGAVAEVLLKLESFEPFSSVKDRLGKALIEGAEERGEITPGETGKDRSEPCQICRALRVERNSSHQANGCPAAFLSLCPSHPAPSPFP